MWSGGVDPVQLPWTIFAKSCRCGTNSLCLYRRVPTKIFGPGTTFKCHSRSLTGTEKQSDIYNFLPISDRWTCHIISKINGNIGQQCKFLYPLYLMPPSNVLAAEF